MWTKLNFSLCYQLLITNAFNNGLKMMFSHHYGALLLTKRLYPFWPFLYIYNKKYDLSYAYFNCVLSMWRQFLIKEHKQKCYIKILCIHIWRDFQTCKYVSRSGGWTFTTQTQSVDIILYIPAPLRSSQQEESRSYHTEKHQQVHAEEHPTTAIQPLRHRMLSPQGSVPEESSQSVFVHSIEKKNKKTSYWLTCPQKAVGKYS